MLDWKGSALGPTDPNNDELDFSMFDFDALQENLDKEAGDVMFEVPKPNPREQASSSKKGSKFGRPKKVSRAAQETLNLESKNLFSLGKKPPLKGGLFSKSEKRMDKYKPPDEKKGLLDSKYKPKPGDLDAVMNSRNAGVGSESGLQKEGSSLLSGERVVAEALKKHGGDIDENEGPKEKEEDKMFKGFSDEIREELMILLRASEGKAPLKTGARQEELEREDPLETRARIVRIMQYLDTKLDSQIELKQKQKEKEDEEARQRMKYRKSLLLAKTPLQKEMKVLDESIRNQQIIEKLWER